MVCIECGSSNPCKCKMLGPTLGFAVGAAVAGVCYPIGCLIYLCAQPQANKLFAAPADVFKFITDAIPI
ncbi:hypothetical protein HYH02_010757 [Chlamydomonas schloesseri]|uniref:Uncharacterized protein n=1 Tax=Chlamydomonas schloesseri TaxID=2026947 RepID=A0A835TJN9_9CHLO|nr:hypothetical protein HYH02_010757 [Chlamydomonas schloesseri]|eukprot:KAG2438965.1 hypothetical protein HYH02_010757 [Chlamydomonas schloesseri]